MPKIKQETAGKIGLFTAVMMIFGTLVGIGIFFKNLPVFNNNHGSPIGILLSWVVAIIMVMSLALSFCEVCTCKIVNKADGLGGWAEKFCGHKFGRYAKLGYSLIFYAVDAFAIMFFAGEGLMNCFASLGGEVGHINFGHLTTLYVFLAGGGLFALFIILNVVASKGMTRFSNVTGLIKFVPLIAVVVLGITFGVLNNNAGLWTGHWYNAPTDYQVAPDITGIIISLPSILFAFEGYVVIGNIAGDMDKPNKNVPLSMIIALIIVSSVYLVVTIGCMTAGTGNVYELMEICFGQGTQLAKIFSNVLSAFIFICIIGVLNAMSFSGMRAFQASCEEGVLFKGKQLANAKPNTRLFAGGVWFSIMVGIWWVATLIPSAILNTDQIVDGSSNIMIIAIYVIYSVILICALVNRFTKRVEVRKLAIFPVTCVIGILSCLFLIGYCGLYQFLAQPLIEKDAYVCSWGLFVESDFKLVYWQTIVCYWSMFAFMLASPLINDLFIKWFDKGSRQVLIWQNRKEDVLK